VCLRVALNGPLPLPWPVDPRLPRVLPRGTAKGLSNEAPAILLDILQSPLLGLERCNAGLQLLDLLRNLSLPLTAELLPELYILLIQRNMPLLGLLGGGGKTGDGRRTLPDLQRSQIGAERRRKPKRGRSSRTSRTGTSNRTDRTLSRTGSWPPTVLDALPQDLDSGAKVIDFLRKDQLGTSNNPVATPGLSPSRSVTCWRFWGGFGCPQDPAQKGSRKKKELRYSLAIPTPSPVAAKHILGGIRNAGTPLFSTCKGARSSLSLSAMSSILLSRG
jgi:hypothetical protein